MRRIGLALLLGMAVSGIAALSVAQTAQKPKFEVVSIKPSAPAGPRLIVPQGDRYRMTWWR